MTVIATSCPTATPSTATPAAVITPDSHFVLPRVLGSDPDVSEGGVEAGHQLTDDTLRSPDVSVGNVPRRPGWVQGAPPLAVEIASAGQDEAELDSRRPASSSSMAVGMCGSFV